MSAAVAAIILAAGRGARYGAQSNKLLVEIGGQPILRCVAAAALASRARRTIVVTGHARHEAEAALHGLCVDFRHNPDFASGLASSLRVGLAAAGGADGALMMLGDMPGVSPSTLDALIAAFEADKDCAAIVPAFRGKRGNPALLSRALFEQVAELDGDTGARDLLRSAKGVVQLPVEDAGILADVNTPADLLRFRRS